jgi:hypothetical protein
MIEAVQGTDWLYAGEALQIRKLYLRAGGAIVPVDAAALTRPIVY